MRYIRNSIISKVVINKSEVLRYQGYKKNSSLRGDVLEILTSEIDEGYKLISPKAIYNQVEVIGISNGVIELDNHSRLSLGGSVEDFRNSNIIGIAVCTIGSALEERVAELFTFSEFAEALMLDSIGSVAVENIADLVNYSICQMAARLNMKVSTRFSPGYGGWDLKDQKVLFQLCDAEGIGVSLNESYMMIPRKSISFCVGIGRELISAPNTNRCRYCNMKECQYRREGK